MIPLVIDTNVLISAMLFGGKPGRLVPLWKEAKIEPYLSREILDEYVRVLAFPKFRLTETEIEYLLYREILPYFHLTAVEASPEIVTEDPTDDKFLHCAVAANSDVVISGDKHLLSLKTYSGTSILGVDRFLKDFGF